MDSRVRVMHVITRLVRGGAQGVVLDLLRSLDPAEYRQVLVAGEQTGSEGSLWPEAEALGVEIRRIPSLVREVSPLRDYQAYRAIRRQIRDLDPHVVHSHTSKAGLLGSLAARHEKVGKVLLAPHGHIMGENARIPGVPSRGMRRWILAEAQRRSCDVADVVIAPNETELADGVRLGIWEPDRSIVVPNGVDVERYHPMRRGPLRRKLGFSDSLSHVGVIARLTAEKGIDTAIEAVSWLDDRTHLYVVGDGPDRSALERLAINSGVGERVHFIGMIPDTSEFLPALDLCLVPSRTEAHGMVAAEALASGVPVVASDIGGLRSLIEPGRTGLRAKPGDVGSFAAALARLLSDRALAKKLGWNGRAFVVDCFSNQVMVDKIESLYRSAVDVGNAETVVEVSS